MNAKFRQLIGVLALSIFFLSFAASASPTEEISLFDYKGRPVAYIAEDRTIYLWEGKPVAYGPTSGGVIAIPGSWIPGCGRKPLLIACK